MNDADKSKPAIKLGSSFDEKFVIDKQKENYSLHFRFNKFEPESETHTANDVTGINAWAVDMDAKDIPIGAQEIRLKNAPVKPSIVVRSKNGYHAYYLASNGSVGNYKSIMERVVAYFDGDESCTQVNKSLRYPGFKHLKEPESPFDVEIRFPREGEPKVYTEEDMRKFPNPVDFGGVSKSQLWNMIKRLDNKEMLLRFSGTPFTNGEEISFVENNDGTQQIFVNGKSSSCWIDSEGMIGSHDGGAPTFVQYLMWYGHKKSDIVQALIRMKILKVTEKEHTFVSYDKLLDHAEEQREKLDYSKSPRYGIDALDVILGGILSDELIIIGADSGLGKSELAYNTEIANAMRGFNVYGLHLEGRITEVSHRHIFREIKTSSNAEASYIDYMMNQVNLGTLPYKAISKIKKLIGERLKIYNRTRPITVRDLKAIIESIKYDADLMVIDHLHYFDYGESDAERIAINKIIRLCKDTTDMLKIPTVLVSHFNRGSENEIPSKNRLMGSSNIAKEADVVILIFPDFSRESNEAEGLYPTFFRIDKSRLGLPRNLLFSVTYDAKAKQYLNGFKVSKILRGGEVEELLPENYPYFLKGKI